MLNYSIEKNGKYIVFNLSGRIDIIGAEKLEGDFKQIVEDEKCYFIVINFLNVTYFSSSAMRIIIALQSRLTSLGGKLKLAKINSMVEKILITLDLYELYEIYDSVEEAISSD